MSKTALLLLAGALGTAAAAGPTSAAELRRARHLMGTRCLVTVIHPQADEAARAASAALDRIASVEDRLSTWRPESELSRANATAGKQPHALSPELERDLRAALDLAERTGGAFDPSVGPLIEAWDLRGEGRVPSPSELSAALASSGHERVRIEGGRLSLPSGGWLETGAFGKGLALDEAAVALGGAEAALLDFGGQLLAVATPPGQEAWRVALADPRDRSRTAAWLALSPGSLATSGQSERSLLVDGLVIGHVLDPRTGRPVRRGGSATVFAPTALEADALATALLVDGRPQDLRHPAALLEATDEGLVLHFNASFATLLLDVSPDVRLRFLP